MGNHLTPCTKATLHKGYGPVWNITFSDMHLSIKSFR
jgi:hypothetical protein